MIHSVRILKNHIRQRIKLAIGILLVVAAIVYSRQFHSTTNGVSNGSITPVGLDPKLDTAAEKAKLAAKLAEPNPADPLACLSLVSPKGEMNENSTIITGSVKNTCGRNFRYVQITFKLIDASGSLVGTALANQSSLDAGETWKFKAHGFVSAPRFRLDHITAF